jgi:hypothetical protein
MGMENYTRYQQGIIKRFYQNQDGIQLQRLSELVTDLYLAEGKKLDKLWQTAAGLLEKMGVPAARVQHIVAARKPELIANLVKEMQG